MSESEMKSEMLKKLVAPIKQQNGRIFWMNVGLIGAKNGKIWVRINNDPKGWDGYCVAVDLQDPGERNEERSAPRTGYTPPAGGADGASDEVPF